jgi:hypothetical protein
LTSLTVDEFQPLVPPFETAFQGQMTRGRLDGQPRPARRFTTDQHCPLPTPADRLLGILVYLKTSSLQGVQGRLFGMGHSQAHQWLHVWLVVLRATRRALGDTPSRSVAELAQRLGVAEGEATAIVVPPEPPPAPAAVPAPGPTSPLVGMRGPHGASRAPRSRRRRRAVSAASKRVTRSKTCG